MTLEKELNELKLNTIKISLIYISSESLNIEKEEIKQKLNLQLYTDLLDELIFIDEELNIKSINSETILSHLNSKKKLLNENLFILLNKEDTLSEKKFNLLFNRYFTFISTWNFLTGLLIIISKILEDKAFNESIKSAFKFQLRIIYDHVEELKKRFEKNIIQLKKENPKLYEQSFKDITNFMFDFEHLFKENVILKKYKTIEEALFELKNKKLNTLEKNKTRFYEFIDHPNCEIIEKVIVEKFNKKTDKSTTIRYIIDYLESKRLLKYKMKSNLLRALKNSFQQDIGSRNGIFDFKYDLKSDRIFKEYSQKLDTLIDELIR